MLDRSRVLKELQEISDKLFIDNVQNYEQAKKIWHRIAADVTFAHKVQAMKGQAPFLIPSWQDKLDEVISLSVRPEGSSLAANLKDQSEFKSLDAYRVLAIDGSQIYPDRHQGTACFLINIGTVVLSYGMSGKSVMLDSKPSVYIGQDEDAFDISAELVNCRRQELEFNAGVALSKQLQEEASVQNVPFIFLFDGSLIFWHLESKEMDLKDRFLSQYLASLHQLYQTKTLTAGYISLPKNKELANLLRLEMCDFNIDKVDPAFAKASAGGESNELDYLVDTTISHFFLEPYSRSIIFKSNSNICEHYPDYLHPHFFYLHVGTEIGRVEIPAWIAQDAHKVNLVATIIIDQSIKGRGYPVAIAESHEQAVVKGPDREFFYQLISKIGFERNQRLIMSQKSIKKRGIGI